MDNLIESPAETSANEKQKPADVKTPSAVSPAERLFETLTPLVEAAGYELVHLEMMNHRQKTLRLFIDVLGNREEKIGVEDCAILSRALDEPLEAMKDVDAYFGGMYELEVSSPGVDRPLRRTRDFEKFAGRDVRIHTLRALTADELGNSDYQSRNPKQKNFLGILGGIDTGTASVKFTILASMGTATKGAKNSKKPEKKDEILIPMTLISKANIEPDYDFSE